MAPERPPGERIAALENERIHTQQSLEDIKSDLKVMNGKITHISLTLEKATAQRKGFLVGLTAATSLGGGLVGAKATTILQALGLIR